MFFFKMKDSNYICAIMLEVSIANQQLASQLNDFFRLKTFDKTSKEFLLN